MKFSPDNFFLFVSVDFIPSETKEFLSVELSRKGRTLILRKSFKFFILKIEIFLISDHCVSAFQGLVSPLTLEGHGSRPYRLATPGQN